jgi:hypothetical protein
MSSLHLKILYHWSAQLLRETAYEVVITCSHLRAHKEASRCEQRGPRKIADPVKISCPALNLLDTCFIGEWARISRLLLTGLLWWAALSFLSYSNNGTCLFFLIRSRITNVLFKSTEFYKNFESFSGCQNPSTPGSVCKELCRYSHCLFSQNWVDKENW